MLAPAPTHLKQNYFAASGSDCVIKPNLNPGRVPLISVYNQLAKYVQCRIKEKKGIELNMPSFSSLLVPVYGIAHWSAFLKKLAEAERMPDLPSAQQSSGGGGIPLKLQNLNKSTSQPSSRERVGPVQHLFSGNAPSFNTPNNNNTSVAPPPTPPPVVGYGTTPDPFMQQILGGGAPLPPDRIGGSDAADATGSSKSNTLIIVAVIGAVVVAGYFLMNK